MCGRPDCIEGPWIVPVKRDPNEFSPGAQRAKANSPWPAGTAFEFDFLDETVTVKPPSAMPVGPIRFSVWRAFVESWTDPTPWDGAG